MKKVLNNNAEWLQFISDLEDLNADLVVKAIEFLIDVAEHLCDHFKNKADFAEVVRMDEKEISKIKKAISMIDDYLQEPNSIAEDWVMVLKLCREALREKVKE